MQNTPLRIKRSIMHYKAFKHRILDELQSHFQESKKISIQEIIKNNGTKYDGLVILDEGFNIAPTLYLNYYFELYQNGTSFINVFEELLFNYESNRPIASIDVSFFTEYELVKNRIVYKIVNYEKNQELLEQIPHVLYLDLAIIFYCLVHSDETGNASILIHNQHMERWNTTTDQLMELANINTPFLMEYSLRSMESILSNESTIPVPDLYPMYVLTNYSKLNGASCILYQDLLKELSSQTESDFFILPSSIHEVILIPAYSKNAIHELSCMVKEVNQTQVSPDEILSDHAYYYSKANDCVSM